MSSYYCLDTSVLMKLLVPEEGHLQARAVFDRIRGTGSLIALPSVAWVEVGNALRKKVRQGLIEPDECQAQWAAFRHLPMARFVETSDIAERAWDIAAMFSLNTLYDAAFLAVAEYVTDQTREVCEFWTADQDLVRTVGGQLDYVRSLASLLSSSPS